MKEDTMSLFNGVIPITGITYLMFCLFLIIFIGYALGRITIKGIDLGTAGVFIVGLIFGCFFYKTLTHESFGVGDVGDVKNALKVIENVGLILFVSTVGFIAGPKFFSNIKKNFKSYVLLGAVIIVSGGVASVICILIGRLLGEPDPKRLTSMVVGLLAGAMTSTPAFSAAKASVGEAYEDIVSVGYGIAYIYGVIGVVLFVQLVPKLTKANIPEELKKITSVSAGEAKKKKPEHMLELDPFGIGVFALCVMIGITLGMVKIPLSAKGLSGTTFSLTTTGGCLLTALIFGHFGHIGKLNIMPPTSMLKVFREFGLVLFLIGAGISGGAQFIQHFRIVYFFYGVFITTFAMLIGYLVATKLLKLSLLNALSAITGGMTSTPALGTLISVAGSEEIASAYAATYPFALICIVLVTQFIIIMF